MQICYTDELYIASTVIVSTLFLLILFQYVTMQKENGFQTTADLYTQVLNANNGCQRCGLAA